MANALYDSGRNAFLTGDIDWVADDIRVILVDTNDYTVNLSTHDFLDDVPGIARVSVSGAMTGKTAVAGVADADDVTLVAVTGDPSEALVIYRHTGVEATSQLIAYIDSAAGLTLTPNGSSVQISWDAGSNKIFRL